VEKRVIDTLYLHELLRREIRDAFEELVQGLEKEWSKKRELYFIIVATVITGLAVNMISTSIIDYVEKNCLNLIGIIVALIILTTSVVMWCYIHKIYNITYRPQTTFVCILSRLRDKGIMKILERLRRKSLVIKSKEVTKYVYEMLKIYHSNAVDEIRLENSSNGLLLDTSREMRCIRVRYYDSLAELSIEILPLPVLTVEKNTITIEYTHDVEIIFTIHLSEEKLRGRALYDVLKGIMYKTQLLVYGTVEAVLHYLDMRLRQS